MANRCGYSVSMPDRPSKKRPRDINQLAKQIVDEATGQAEPEPDQDEGKNAAAVELGRLGGLKGGVARAEKLTPEERSVISRKAAAARWGLNQDSESARLGKKEKSTSKEDQEEGDQKDGR